MKQHSKTVVHKLEEVIQHKNCKSDTELSSSRKFRVLEKKQQSKHNMVDFNINIIIQTTKYGHCA